MPSANVYHGGAAGANVYHGGGNFAPGGYHPGQSIGYAAGYRSGSPGHGGGFYPGGYHQGGYHPGGYYPGRYPGYNVGRYYYNRNWFPYGGAGLWFGLGLLSAANAYDYYLPDYYMPPYGALDYAPPAYGVLNGYGPAYGAPAPYPPGSPAPDYNYSPAIPWYFPTFSAGISDYLLYNYLMAAPQPAPPGALPAGQGSVRPQTAPRQGAAPVVVRVRVPADAEVWFENTKTRQIGTDRMFESPPLPPGGDFIYEVRASWSLDGQPVTQTRKVVVHGGQEVNVDFTSPSR